MPKGAKGFKPGPSARILLRAEIGPTIDESIKGDDRIILEDA